MHKYINLRAEYGFSQTFTMDYRSDQEIMEQMDRLGIWQTLVEFTGASNTLYRAKRLMKEIREVTEWRQRIIPCFMSDPALLFMKGGVEEFKQILRDAAPCCLSFYPKNGKYRIRMADALLEQVQEFCSVVLIDKAQLSGEGAADDLIYLANRFPEMSFIIRNFSWGFSAAPKTSVWTTASSTPGKPSICSAVISAPTASSSAPTSVPMRAQPWPPSPSAPFPKRKRTASATVTLSISSAVKRTVPSCGRTCAASPIRSPTGSGRPLWRKAKRRTPRSSTSTATWA